jgi:hypothetical protein
MTTIAPSTNGKPPMTPREAAPFYHGRGFIPIPVLPRSKRPALDGWPDFRPGPDDLDALFPAEQEGNLGLLLGAPSRGLLDADLDVAEAIKAACFLLPPTGWVTGRKLHRISLAAWKAQGNNEDEGEADR